MNAIPAPFLEHWRSAWNGDEALLEAARRFAADCRVILETCTGRPVAELPWRDSARALPLEWLRELDVTPDSAATAKIDDLGADPVRKSYERLIPAAIRKRNGEFHTPPALADRVVAGLAEFVAGQGGGAILNIASVTADKPLSGVFAYSASKAAVVNLTQNVARELAPQGVRVNALCPGFFPAEQNRAILTPERSAKILAQTPLARFGEPRELVGAALLLLSREAGSFITGAAFYVDGGFTAMRF